MTWKDRMTPMGRITSISDIKRGDLILRREYDSLYIGVATGEIIRGDEIQACWGVARSQEAYNKKLNTKLHTDTGLRFNKDVFLLKRNMKQGQQTISMDFDLANYRKIEDIQ